MDNQFSKISLVLQFFHKFFQKFPYKNSKISSRKFHASPREAVKVSPTVRGIINKFFSSDNSPNLRSIYSPNNSLSKIVLKSRSCWRIVRLLDSCCSVLQFSQSLKYNAGFLDKDQMKTETYIKHNTKTHQLDGFNTSQ